VALIHRTTVNDAKSGQEGAPTGLGNEFRKSIDLDQGPTEAALLPVPLNLERESYLEHRTGPVPDLDCHPMT